MPRRSLLLASNAGGAVLSPSLGLYFDRSPLAVPDRALVDGYNFRIKNGRLSNLNLGWERFKNFALNGPVLLIDNFLLRTGSQIAIYATFKDLYRLNEGPGTVSYLTPRYETGTVSVTNGSAGVTGVGTVWTTNLKAGDEMAFGATGIVDPLYATNGGWYVILSVNSDTSITLATNFTGATQSGIAYTGRKLFTGDVDDLWDTDVFYNAPGGADLWMATNGKDRMVKWDGTGTQVTITVMDFIAKFLSVYKNMMIYGNVTFISTGTPHPTSFINSHTGEPENVTGGLSEQFQVHEGGDVLLNAVVLGDALTFYSERHAVLAQFVGDPLVFIFRSAANDVGPIAPRAIADFGDRHEFLGFDTGYRFDGASVTQFNTHIWRETLRTRDPVRRKFTFTHFDEENGDLLWAVPQTTDTPGTVGADTAQAEHYLEQIPPSVGVPFSRRKFPFTTMGYFQRATSIAWSDLTQAWENVNFAWNDQFFQAAFPFNMAGDQNGKIYTYGTSQRGDGALLPSFVLTPRRAVGDGRMRGLVSRVYPFASFFAGDTLDVTLFLHDHAMGVGLQAGPFAFDTDLLEGQHFVAPYRRARFVQFQFSSTGTAWELSGWTWDRRSGGIR